MDLQSLFILFNWNCVPFDQHLSLSTSSSPWQPPFCSLLLWIELFYIPHTSEIKYYLSFCVWLILLSILSSRSIHGVTNGRISFFLNAAWYCIVHIHHIFFIHSSISGQSGCLHTFVVIQSLNHVWLSVTPWTAASQASRSNTNSWTLLKLMSIKWCHPTISSSAILFSSCPQSFPASGSFGSTPWLL